MLGIDVLLRKPVFGMVVVVTVASFVFDHRAYRDELGGDDCTAIERLTLAAGGGLDRKRNIEPCDNIHRGKAFEGF